MKYKIVAISLLLASQAHAAFLFFNYGHRSGGGKDGYYTDLAENSLDSLHATLEGRAQYVLQDDPKFIYLETDVRETYDHHLVMSHDASLNRVIDWESGPTGYLDQLLTDPDVLKRHGASYLDPEDLEINKLTLAEIQKFHLKHSNDPMPTLDEYLSACAQWHLRKPVAVEIKKLESDQGRQLFLSLLHSFRQDYLGQVSVNRLPRFDFPDDLTIMSFPWAFTSSVGTDGSPQRQSWCQALRDSGFTGVFMPLFHHIDNCE